MPLCQGRCLQQRKLWLREGSGADDVLCDFAETAQNNFITVNNCVVNNNNQSEPLLFSCPLRSIMLAPCKSQDLRLTLLVACRQQCWKWPSQQQQQQQCGEFLILPSAIGTGYLSLEAA